MKPYTIQEAQDIRALAIQTIERLTRAAARVAELRLVPAEEHGWLEVATRRVSEGLARVDAALGEATSLPEFESKRKLNSEALSNAWADAIERVFDGIVANVSANGPLIEALFPHQRFAALRRPGAAARNFWLEFERRSESSYVKRLCGDAEYQFLRPLLDAAKSSERELREAASPRPIPGARADELRAAVSVAAEGLELSLRQARSLSEAVFAETPIVISELGLDAKLKRRPPRAEGLKPEVG
jgi:hypothetical protein